MFYINFLMWLMLLILINVRRSNNSLLSRFRNPNEYVPRDDENYFFPEDIDDDLYAELLQEVPELAGRLRINPNDLKESTLLPFIRKEVNRRDETIPYDENFNIEKDEDQEEYPGQLNYITVTEGPKNISSSTNQLPFLTRQPPNSSEEWKRRKRLKKDPFSLRKPEKPIARCYWCGMNHSTMIPKSPMCHDVFESPDFRARKLYRFLRAHCYQRSTYSWLAIKGYQHSTGKYYYKDEGLIRLRYGYFVGGCFKRFLDVGKVYTQRGCRKYWPLYPWRPSFATHRFVRMEALLKEEKEYCLVSPQASLTPFSRAISLYVRYHVCVCAGRYCNNRPKLQYNLSLITSVILLVIFMSF